MEVLYTAEATATGGRKNGHAYSSDGAIDVQINPPKEVGGSGEGTNPEQLFAAGYSSCFHNALILVGNREGYDLTGSTVSAKVGIGPNRQRGYGLAVALSVSLPVIDQDIARNAECDVLARRGDSVPARGDADEAGQIGRPEFLEPLRRLADGGLPCTLLQISAGPIERTATRVPDRANRPACPERSVPVARRALVPAVAEDDPAGGLGDGRARGPDHRRH